MPPIDLISIMPPKDFNNIIPPIYLNNIMPPIDLTSIMPPVILNNIIPPIYLNNIMPPIGLINIYHIDSLCIADIFLNIHVLILYSGCNETHINATILFFLLKNDSAVFFHLL